MLWSFSIKARNDSIDIVQSSYYNDYKVYGLSREQVLLFDGDPLGNPCSMNHKNGDFSNRWCHGFVVSAADTFLKTTRINPLIRIIASTFLFIPKEFFYDKNPDWADVVTPEIPILKTNEISLGFAVSGDKMFILSFEAKF